MLPKFTWPPMLLEGATGSESGASVAPNTENKPAAAGSQQPTVLDIAAYKAAMQKAGLPPNATLRHSVDGHDVDLALDSLPTVVAQSLGMKPVYDGLATQMRSIGIDPKAPNALEQLSDYQYRQLEKDLDKAIADGDQETLDWLTERMSARGLKITKGDAQVAPPAQQEDQELNGLIAALDKPLTAEQRAEIEANGLGGLFEGQKAVIKALVARLGKLNSGVPETKVADMVNRGVEDKLKQQKINQGIASAEDFFKKQLGDAATPDRLEALKFGAWAMNGQKLDGDAAQRYFQVMKDIYAPHSPEQVPEAVLQAAQLQWQQQLANKAQDKIPPPVVSGGGTSAPTGEAKPKTMQEYEAWSRKLRAPFGLDLDR